MIGEISVAGVFIPALLLLGTAALALTALASGLLSALGVYRLVAYRPLVDVAIFVLFLGLVVLLTAPPGSFS